MSNEKSVIGPTEAMMKTCFKLMAYELYDHLAHGDDEHRAWLKAKIFEYFDNDQVTTYTINILRSNSAGTEKLLLNIPYGTTYTDTVPVPTSTIRYFYEVQAQGPGGRECAE